MGTHPIFESDFDCLTDQIMSFQWQFVAVVLYVEIGITLLLCLRFISSKWWSAFFKSGIAQSIASNGSTLFYILTSILGMFFIDAFRDVRKYDLSDKEVRSASHDLAALNQHLMYKFRAQRNLYISGFALFLWIVIQRLTTLISDKARTKAEAAAAKSQAESASRTAELLLDQNREMEEKGKDSLEEETKEKLKKMEEKLTKAMTEAKSAREELMQKSAECEAMKKQSEGLAREYDRVTEELANAINNGSGDKKDD